MKSLRNLNTFQKEMLSIGCIFLFTLTIIFSTCPFDAVYGSNTDWSNQHYAIPEYFRNLFYDTGQLIPSYAPNIGAGERIFSLSYYGLLSPIILPSYLLPFVSMGKYIRVTAILIALCSEFALFFLLRKNYSIRTCFLVTLFFTISPSLIQNTHRHIMFISFMPFLLLALYGAEDYFKYGKKAKLSVCVFLAIMCNFYFAPSITISVFSYGLYICFRDHLNIRKLCFYTLCIFIGILASAVLLLPTAYGIFESRDASNFQYNILELLFSLRLDKLTYADYPMGISAFGVFSAFYSKGKNINDFLQY